MFVKNVVIKYFVADSCSIRNGQMTSIIFSDDHILSVHLYVNKGRRFPKKAINYVSNNKIHSSSET